MNQPFLFSPVKTCTLCGVNPSSGRGPCQTCTDAGNALKDSYRIKKTKRRTGRIPDETKTCSLCEQTTNILNFHVRNKNTGERSKRCAECVSTLKFIQNEEGLYWSDRFLIATTYEEQLLCNTEYDKCKMQNSVFTRYAIEQCLGISGSLSEKYVQWCMS